jgi:hypothetical protein
MKIELDNRVQEINAVMALLAVVDGQNRECKPQAQTFDCATYARVIFADAA